MASYPSLSAIGRIGRYDLLGRMAVGGMAEIYLARDAGPRAIHRHLVVKRVLPHVAEDERAVEMFVQEASLCVRLKHPNICPIYEFGEADGAFFLAMEWVRGVSLRDVIHRAGVKGGMPIGLVCHLFADLAGALHHAHTARDERGQALGIVHRDVTPENIIVGFDGVVKLIDFGIAKAAKQPHKTEKGVLKGKFAYISPEQYQGKPLDGRSDVFSLAVCLYEALTSHSLYERASEYETVAAIVLDPDVPNVRDTRSEVPEHLDFIVRRGLAKDRDERFQSADELQIALQKFNARRGEVVRHAEVAAYLDQLFPGRREAEPELDRRPPTLPVHHEAPEAERRRERTHSSEMDKVLAGIEADALEKEMRGRQRRKALTIFLVAVVVLVGLAGAAYWVIKRPRTSEAHPDPSAQPG